MRLCLVFTGSRSSDQTRKRYGILFLSYYPEFYWFELVHLAEKFLLIFAAECVNSISVGSALQLLNTTAVLSSHLFFRPLLTAENRRVR